MHFIFHTDLEKRDLPRSNDTTKQKNCDKGRVSRPKKRNQTKESIQANEKVNHLSLSLSLAIQIFYLDLLMSSFP